MPIRFIFLHYIDDIHRKVEGDSIKTVEGCQLITVHFTVYIRDTEHIPEAGVFWIYEITGILAGVYKITGIYKLTGDTNGFDGE